jgi:ABC-type lipoprotein release transport system permease subunit
VEELVLDREVRAILDTPEKSDMIILSELTPGNLKRLGKYIRPVKGRLPEKPDEIAVSEFLKEGVYNVGDLIYITTTTPDKVINTIRYKVVGITKSSGWKGLGSAFLISEESMNRLTNTTKHGNMIYAFLDQTQYNTRDKIDALFDKMKTALERGGITINDSWKTYERLDKLSNFVDFFGMIRSLVIIVFFTLVGAVVAAMIWMVAFRRRKEIWTYSAMGMRNKKIVILMALEYWMLALAGTLLGIFGGALSAYAVEKANIWFRFSYTFVSPLQTVVQSGDIIGIVIFIFISVTVWIFPPMRRIIKAPPFSY